MQEVKKIFNFTKNITIKKLIKNKSLCRGRRIKVKDIDVTKVIQNPSLINGWEEAFRKYCLAEKISNELTNQLIKNSKIINWPNELNSMELMKKNKAEFLKLCNYKINIF